MSVIWLIVWLLHGTPRLYEWNNWLVALIVCLAIDVLSGGGIRVGVHRG